MNPNDPKFSICIASHNQGHLLSETLGSILKQDYKNLEIVVLDDASTDQTETMFGFSTKPGAINYYRGPLDPRIKYFRSETPSGTGGAFNKAIEKSTGEFVMMLCSDDILTDPRIVSDMMKIFTNHANVAHITRYYYQFETGDPRPVRAWRGVHVMELANNPSGLTFRREALKDPNNEGKLYQLSNNMFVEASTLVFNVMKNPNVFAMIMPWDTVAVRIHQSTARSKEYYKKRWVSSPVEEWSKVGGASLQADFTSLVQIKNYFTIGAVLKECWKFIDLRPINILNPAFIFYAIISIFMPRIILMRLPHLYRITIGRWTTKEIKRPDEQKKT